MEKPLSMRQGFVIFSILASLWLLKHPYNGIWHDGVIYTFMALKDLYPDNFAGDLFIKYGSQENYTIFPQVYAVLIKYFGIYKSALLLTVVGQILWISSAILLFRLFFSGKEVYVSLAILFFIRAYYGGFNCFQYAETFVSPRIFSEALCILSARCILKRKFVAATIFVAISFFTHPLMTFSACLVFYAYLVLTYPKFLFSAPILAAIILFLGFIKIEPFAGLFRFIPQDWMEIIKVRSSFMCLQQWPLSSWTTTFFTIVITGTACLFTKNTLRRLLLASITGTFLGMLINLIGGEILKLEILMQIQTWRALWFLQFISTLGTAVIIFKFLEMEENKLLMFGFFILTWYCTSLGVISFFVTLLFGYLCLKISNNKLPAITIIRPFIILVMVIVIIISILLPSVIGMIKILMIKDYNLKLLSLFADYSFFNIFNPLVLLFVISLFYYVTKREPMFMILILSFLLVIFSLAVWDRQSAWSKMLEQNNEDHAFFRDVLPPKATVLWDAVSEFVWFGTKRPCYISAHQGSGVVFYRGTALEYVRRVKTTLPLMNQNPLTVKEISYKLNWGLDDKKLKKNYQSVCRAAEGLDYIVSTERIAGQEIARWHSSIRIEKRSPLEDGTAKETPYYDFYLYDCGRYRTLKN